MNRPKANALTAVLIMVTFVPSSRLFADEPLARPFLYTIWSPNKKFCGVLDPDKKTTTVYQAAEDGKRTEQWSMPGWFRVAALADDGEHLVTGYDGMNLIPVNYTKDLVMLSFYRKGDLIRTVTLDQLIKDTSRLQRTVSHFVWGDYIGIDAEGHYLVKTVEGRTISFDMTTGQPDNSP